MLWLKPEDVNKPGQYLMTRTDDSGPFEPIVVEMVQIAHMPGLYLLSWQDRDPLDLNKGRDRIIDSNAIDTYDSECRFLGPIQRPID